MLPKVRQVIQAAAHHEHGVGEKKNVHFFVIVVLGGLESLAAVVVLKLGVLPGDNKHAHDEARSQDKAQHHAEPVQSNRVQKV